MRLPAASAGAPFSLVERAISVDAGLAGVALLFAFIAPPEIYRFKVSFRLGSAARS